MNLEMENQYFIIHHQHGREVIKGLREEDCELEKQPPCQSQLRPWQSNNEEHQTEIKC